MHDRYRVVCVIIDILLSGIINIHNQFMPVQLLRHERMWGYCSCMQPGSISTTYTSASPKLNCGGL